MNYKIDNLQYCNWSRKVFQINREAELDAVHVTVVYHEDYDEFLDRVKEWDNHFKENSDLILMTDDRATTKQRLHLLLEQAQLGLISENETVYVQSLLKAKELLVLLAAEHSELGKSIMVEIDDLAAINIDPTVPQLKESLKLMNELTSRLQDLR